MRKRKEKSETDKYELSWHQTSPDGGIDSYARTIWESPTYVGPGAFNCGHVDWIIENYRNRSKYIMLEEQPFLARHRRLHVDNAKFKP